MVAEGCWVSPGGDENVLRWTVVTVAHVSVDGALNPTDPRTLNGRTVWCVRDRSYDC